MSLWKAIAIPCAYLDKGKPECLYLQPSRIENGAGIRGKRQGMGAMGLAAAELPIL